MAVTSPDEIWSPDSGDQYALTTDLAAMADTVQDGLNRRVKFRKGAGVPTVIASDREADQYLNTSTDIQYRFNGTSWVPFESVWRSFTPTWTAANTAPALGNGSLIGRYKYVGQKAVDIRYELRFGSTTSGGSGAWQFSMPFETPSSGEQILPAKAFLAGPTWDFAGVALIQSGGNVVRPMMPESISSTVLKRVQNANSGGGSGSGIPVVSGNYSYLTGSILAFGGVIEIS